MPQIKSTESALYTPSIKTVSYEISKPSGQLSLKGTEEHETITLKITQNCDRNDLRSAELRLNLREAESVHNILGSLLEVVSKPEDENWAARIPTVELGGEAIADQVRERERKS